MLHVRAILTGFHAGGTEIARASIGSCEAMHFCDYDRLTRWSVHARNGELHSRFAVEIILVTLHQPDLSKGTQLIDDRKCSPALFRQRVFDARWDLIELTP